MGWGSMSIGDPNKSHKGGEGALNKTKSQIFVKVNVSMYWLTILGMYKMYKYTHYQLQYFCSIGGMENF